MPIATSLSLSTDAAGSDLTWSTVSKYLASRFVAVAVAASEADEDEELGVAVVVIDGFSGGGAGRSGSRPSLAQALIAASISAPVAHDFNPSG
ncbi:hypothetical protein [Nocardioides carbamazepini]|uniref:hypothetical protein n=1 Tax=Nocardioides carbamazepini TaxID=2854259 RepID=UPI00214A1B50|nr:hypothetical protein [Nocardioides carbamazepini]